jgi:hypothetical protein
MTATTGGKYLQLFGLFELDDAGTILYSRPSENGEPRENGRSIVGQNFFEEMGPIENGDFLRQHFRNFLESKRSMDSFLFEGSYAETPLRARILMTRGHETHHDPPAGIVIMDIKKA